MSATSKFQDGQLHINFLRRKSSFEYRSKCWANRCTTPTAVFDNNSAGTSVSRAVLHNQQFITEKDIRIGDIILVRKAEKLFRGCKIN